MYVRGNDSHELQTLSQVSTPCLIAFPHTKGQRILGRAPVSHKVRDAVLCVHQSPPKHWSEVKTGKHCLVPVHP